MKRARLVPAHEGFLRLALEHLRAGEPLVFPTDTVYGLGAPSDNEPAVRRIYEIKDRPLEKPIALLLADADDIASIVSGFPAMARNLADHFFPGPLTLVLPSAATVPRWVTAGRPSVAVRVPDQAFARSLIRAVGRPLATTSANLAGSAAPVDAQEAYEELGDVVALIMDGGPCRGGVESTVLDLTGPSPVLLREGALTREVLESVCGRVMDVLK